MRRRLTGVLAVAATAALLGAAPAGAGPTATKSGEELLTYVTKGKIKVAKRLIYKVRCSVDCAVVAQSTLVGPGPNISATISGPLPAGAAGGPILKPNGPLLDALKADRGKFKLKTKVSATDLATGATDNDSRSFNFK